MGCSTRTIAVSLGRSPSTISREIARNGGRSAYRAAAADQLPISGRRRPKPPSPQNPRIP
ncbi:helix-turn-helix domain-containing protein [Nocardia carnea]|uniref:helix-turn-helix domain-containing protein n=1 Tax=Nocardia carnea TaxID=37328 RepID=UPI003D79219B